MVVKPSIIFVLGPPASGKGTLCKRLVDNHKDYLYHLSAGDYLRYLINGPLANQADIVDVVRNGGTKGLVRGDVIVSLLIDKIKEEMANGKFAFLLDGFPRNLEQDKAFKELMSTEFNLSPPNLLISIACSRDVARPRYLNRNRGDDKKELFEQRFSDYENRDREIVELYQQGMVMIKTGEGLSIDQSYLELVESLYKEPAWNNIIAKDQT